MVEYLIVGAVAIVIVIFAAARVRLRNEDGRGLETSAENATAAATLMKDWAVWLAAIQTAVTSGILLLFGGKTTFPPLAGAAALFLSASVLLESILLAGLPTLVLRLKDGCLSTNDLYEMPLFVFLRIRTGAVYLLTHIFFATGMTFMAVQFLWCGVPAWPK